MDTYNLTTTTELQQAVHTIKTAILKSQSRAARLISGTQLSLYFGVGLYVSSNSRKGTWGTGAIEVISNQLRRELPGLKGFSAQNIRNMRQFAEFWQAYLIYSPMASEINRDEFLGISFSHHMEILHKTKKIDEVLHCIHETVIHQWDKYTLRDVLKMKQYG